jgi:phosphonate transport system substrate-binding protein
VLTTVQTDGSTGYYAIMVARADSGITTLADMKGKKLGFADPDSTSGYLVPVTALPKDIGMEVKDYFASTGFGGGHEQLVLEVLKGTFDAGTTWGSGVGDFKDGYTSGNLHKMVEKGILKMDDLVELWKSPLIPNGPLVVRTSLPADAKQKIVDFMTKLPETDPACFSAVQGGEYKGFTPVKPEFYQAIIDARKAKIG